ncbi:hypothetical protein [Mucilaginibacter sp.]|uniref:hypothetical protein n=1 Tax=Mucilaginibacter sp. TaxID=1882438 RepID=UPI0025F5D062|nr:hypothetical protein [Mucilaginibacter sp.]
MKNLIRIFLFIAALPLLATAQSNYKPGYVINLKGDTLRGFIDYRGWDTNPDVIKFKQAQTSTVERLTVNEINFFSLDKVVSYKKYTGTLSMDNANPDNVQENRDTTFKIASVFLKVLQKGKNVALYSYSDNIKTRLFIGDQPNYQPAELVYRLYYDMEAVKIFEHGRTVNENTYMSQLYTLAAKYNAVSTALQRDIEDSAYREYYVLQIVKKINEAVK